MTIDIATKSRDEAYKHRNALEQAQMRALEQGDIAAFEALTPQLNAAVAAHCKAIDALEHLRRMAQRTRDRRFAGHRA